MRSNSLSASRDTNVLPMAPNPGVDTPNGIHIKTKETDCLSDHEMNLLQEQIDVTEVKTTYETLYRYATAVDAAVIVLSSL